jgi:hypothetical protein
MSTSFAGNKMEGGVVFKTYSVLLPQNLAGVTEEICEQPESE